MLFLINRRYPRLGVVLSALSSVAFIALGVAEHSTFMIASSVVFMALPILRAVARRRMTHPAQS